MVTGGTGFVGAGVTAGLVGAGHDVRLLVRRPAQVPASLSPWGVRVDDLVEGDVLDPDAVDRALDGCDAVVHAAAVYSLDARRADEMRRTNERAAELVLTRAVERGLDPVVHVSSTVALTRRGGSGPDLPLGDVTMPYTASKIASEMVARRLQDGGAPVVTVYPGGVLGPHDPYRGDQGERLRWQLLGRLPLWPRGGTHVVDVRTVADTVVAVLRPGRGPRRYVVPGHHGTGDLLYSTLTEVTGRRLPHVELPERVVVPAIGAVEAVQRRLPGRLHMPTDLEGVVLAVRDTRVDDGPARTELGVAPAPFDRTVRDTVVWLVESGRMPARYAGKALGPRGERGRGEVPV